MNYHKKVQVGGDLGAELERIWAAIRSNQIKTSPGQRINRTPNGTTISFGTESAEAISLPAPTNKIGTLMEIHPFPFDAPEIDNGLKQLGVVMRIDNTYQMVLLPPVSGNLPNTFEHEGRYFPSALYDGTNSGSSWAWGGGIGSLKRYMDLEVRRFKFGFEPWTQSNIATHSPPYSTAIIHHYIEAGQFPTEWYQT